MSRIEMVFRRDFFSLEAVRGFPNGGMPDRIDNHRPT
jgi:hypothetical protein